MEYNEIKIHKKQPILNYRLKFSRQCAEGMLTSLNSLEPGIGQRSIVLQRSTVLFMYAYILYAHFYISYWPHVIYILHLICLLTC